MHAVLQVLHVLGLMAFLSFLVLSPLFPSSEIGRQIEQSQKSIVQYKEELQRSKVICRHRQEYDAMAKVGGLYV